MADDYAPNDLRDIKPPKEGARTEKEDRYPLYEWLPLMEAYLQLKGLDYTLALDENEDLDGEADPDFDWDDLDAATKQDDRLTRYQLYTNLSPETQLAVKGLTHAAQVWRRLNKVKCLGIWCVLVFSVVVFAGP